MRITDFAKLVAMREGKKRQVNIAQISEILKIIDKLLGGCLYWIIRHIDI